MEIIVKADARQAGGAAAVAGAAEIRKALGHRGTANIILATGASQLDMLDALVREPQIDWPSVVGFHLDEYVGLSDQHPGSCRRYLRERFVDQLNLRAFHFVRGDMDAYQECQRLCQLIQGYPIDVAFIGIGENGHLAFNDPPADMETEDPFLIVELDETSRRQQASEGWFESIDDVPRRAITMSIRQILSANRIICTVPDARKAPAVRDAVLGQVTNEVPASALQQHPRVTLFLDEDSASLLETRNAAERRPA